MGRLDVTAHGYAGSGSTGGRDTKMVRASGDGVYPRAVFGADGAAAQVLHGLLE